MAARTASPGLTNDPSSVFARPSRWRLAKRVHASRGAVGHGTARGAGGGGANVDAAIGQSWARDGPAAAALQAGETALSRILPFTVLVCGSDHLTPRILAACSGRYDNPQGIGRTAASCVNRWCSLDQWVAYEHASVACALDFRAGSSTCDEMVADDAWWPGATRRRIFPSFEGRRDWLGFRRPSPRTMAWVWSWLGPVTRSRPVSVA